MSERSDHKKAHNNHTSCRNDHIYFNFFDGTTVYDNQDSTKGTVARGPHKDEASMFSRVRALRRSLRQSICLSINLCNIFTIFR